MGLSKRTAKQLLRRAGLLGAAERLYFNARAASLDVVRRELAYLRGAQAEDGAPLPSGRLVFDVIACRWRAVYLDSGKEIVDDMLEILETAGTDLRTWTPEDRVLDFGCGCGRLIRQLRAHTAAELHGTDYNPMLVAWCAEHLRFARFGVNTLAPPLDYPDRAFRLVYARSVFTHLDTALFEAWVTEMRRVVRKNGMLYITMHGNRLAGALERDQRAHYDRGELVVTYASVAGENLCATYANRDYTERTFGAAGFELAAFRQGRTNPHLRQDIYVFRRVD